MRIFILFAVSFLAAEQASAACGKFVVVKGDVQIDVLKTKQSEKAKVNSEICAGDTVGAGADSRAKIVMVDGNELNISPDTKMTIEGYEFQPEQEKKKVLLNVLFGKVRANVKQKYDDQAKDSASNSFQVKTKSAVAGVRGTDFLTSYAPSTGKSEVVTFAGKVDVGQPGAGGRIMNPVSVGAGQKTDASPNQAPSKPVAVPPGELKNLNNSTNASTASSNSSSSTASNSKSSAKAGGPTTVAAGNSDSGSANSSTSSNSSSSSSASSTSSSNDSRAPASSSNSMISSNETGGAATPGATVPSASGPQTPGPIAPPIIAAPPAAVAAVVPVVPNISSIVKSVANATVNITINPHR